MRSSYAKLTHRYHRNTTLRATKSTDGSALADRPRVKWVFAGLLQMQLSTLAITGALAVLISGCGLARQAEERERTKQAEAQLTAERLECDQRYKSGALK